MKKNSSNRWQWTVGDRGKALAIVFAVILSLSIAFVLYGVNQHNKTIDLLIDKTEEDIGITVAQLRNKSLRNYEKRMQTFLNVHPEILAAFAGRDRERLYELCRPLFTILQTENKYFTNMHFHLPDGRSFLRVHDPAMYGDDLTLFRPSIQRMLKEHKMSSGFEIGAHGGFFRIIAPVFSQNEYVGSVEFALSMDLSVDIVRSLLRMPVTTYFPEVAWKAAHLFAGSPIVRRDSFVIISHGDPLYDKLPQDLHMGEDIHSLVRIEGRYYIVHSHNIFENFENYHVGGLLVLQDVTVFIKDKQGFLRNTVVFTFFLMILGFISLHFSFNRLFGQISRESEKRKEAEMRFRETTALLESLIDSIPDYIYYKDVSGVYLGCNRAFVEMTGHGRTDVVGHSDAELFSPQLAAFFTVHDQEVIGRKRSLVDERWVELKGCLEYLHTFKTPYQGPDGRLIGVIGVSRNLTVYREATEALEQAAQEWAAAMDAVPDAVYILDLDRFLLQANKCFYQMMGLEPATGTGRHISTIIHPQGEPVPCPVCQAQEELQDAHIVMEAEHPDNPSGVPLEITVTIVRDPAGKPLSILMRLHDLSEQRVVEDRLRQSKEEWERTFDAISDLITIQDRDMTIVRANQAAEEFFQVEHGGLVGRRCHEVFRGEDSPCQGCPLLMVTGQGGEHPAIIRHENLQKIFHLSSSPLLGEDGKIDYMVHIARDITAQKELEEELFQAHKMEAVGTLAGGIAHDFNNILAAIIGFTELIRDDLAADSPSRADVEQVLLAAGRAKELVRQILSYSRKSANELQIFEPYLLVKEVVAMLQATLPSTVVIEEDLDPESGSIKADPAKIHQVLVNLCTNGFQAMSGEKGVLHVGLQRREIHEKTALEKGVSAGSYIMLEVRDTGEGMDEQTRERIFDPFFTTKEVGKGTGMGLSVLQGIVRDHKGFVDVHSQPGHGSTFQVYLPITEALETPAGEQQSAVPKIGGSEKILIVDDDPLLVRINDRVLSSLGYRVTQATSSVEALELVRAEPERFDLLITDQTMPQLTGAELAAQVIALSPHVKIIMCTGHSAIVSEQDALAMGIHRYVFKPIQGSELVEAVREVLDEKNNGGKR